MTDKETKPNKYEWFNTAKTWFYIGATAISIYLMLEIKAEVRTNRDYEAATQNVTNRFIGMLEGQGQKQCSDKVLDYIQAVEKEKKIRTFDFEDK